MSRLTAKTLYGIWAGVTMCWDSQDRFDEKPYRANTEAMCRAGVHGIYTTGSTGEFYALDDDEFRFGPPVDLEDGEKLPFAVVCEILLEVGFAPGFTIHVYYPSTRCSRAGRGLWELSRSPVFRSAEQYLDSKLDSKPCQSC